MVKNTVQLIEKAEKLILSTYDMGTNNMKDIYCISKGPYDLMSNSFKFGFIQGMKAAIAHGRKGGMSNG